MAKPRVFVSSTYYDLRYVRASLDEFIRNIVYEAILFEKGDIPFQHDQLLEDSCVGEVNLADIFVLIIGGRYGSLSTEDVEQRSSDPENFFQKVRSITRKEYERAREKQIPLYIFIEKDVLSEFKTFQKNRSKFDVDYAHVDDIRIFYLIDDIFKERLNNFVRGFDKTEEIIVWLRDQWAGIFAESLRNKSDRRDISGLSFQVAQLSSVVSSLQSYSENFIRESDPNADILINAERMKQKQFLANSIIEFAPIGWFSRHPATMDYFKTEEREQRLNILHNLIKANGLIEFLIRMRVPHESLVLSTVGVEDERNQEYTALKRALAIAGVESISDVTDYQSV